MRSFALTSVIDISNRICHTDKSIIYIYIYINTPHVKEVRIGKEKKERKGKEIKPREKRERVARDREEKRERHAISSLELQYQAIFGIVRVSPTL